MSETIATPTRPEEITAVWLTKALQSTGVIGRETAVASLSLEPLSGAGYAGQTARIRPLYKPSAKNLPATLIAKFSHPDPTLRQALFWAYEREDFFYRRLAQQVSLNTPTCYFTAYNPETFQSVLLLQDLAHLRMFDLTAGCGLAEAQTVVTHLARHHVVCVPITAVFPNENPSKLELGSRVGHGSSGGGVFWQGFHIANNWQQTTVYEPGGSNILHQFSSAALNSVPLSMEILSNVVDESSIDE